MGFLGFYKIFGSSWPNGYSMFILKSFFNGWVAISLVTVLEFHDEVGEIQMNIFRILRYLAKSKNTGAPVFFG